MARHASLAPRKDSSKNRWVVSLPKSLSSTGQRQREYFKTKAEAEKRSDQLLRLQAQSARVVREAGPELIKDAVNYDELFRTLYGFENGLSEACEEFMKRLDLENRTPNLFELLNQYETDKSSNWKNAYRTKWNWFRKHVNELGGESSMVLDSKFWTEWLRNRSKREKWSDRTFNEVTSMLSSVWEYAVTQSVVDKNPIKGVVRKKIRKEQVPVYTVEEVEKVMNCSWNHDREMVPFFAITIFAGIRPDSEILTVDWEDIDFDELEIRVAKDFDNKTETKRFVPIEENLLTWLAPWKNRSGSVLPKNHVRRRQWITRGKYQSADGTPEKEWTELVPYNEKVRDITRHTYGSFLDARYRDRNMVKANMGHTNFQTYDQHYKRAVKAKDAERFWAIMPPQ